MKNQKILEVLAIAASLLAILGAVSAPFYVQTEALETEVPAGARVVNLTAMAEAGYWTEEEVRGGNYWARSFTPARPVLRAGEPVLLRFKSVDVVHTFYSPELGIGPVEVYPGHVSEVLLRPDKEGVFGYFCTTMCGDPHFGMRGVVIVRGDGVVPAGETPPEESQPYWLKPPPPPSAGLVERGRWLFEQKGCATCHGPGGTGGVQNYNYINGTVPALNTLAERMFLTFPEDVEEVVGQLQQERPLEELQETTAIPRFRAVLAQYESIRKVIRNGNPPGKADPDGPPPPLEMPAWQYQLSERNIDAVLGYLLTQQFANEGD